MTALLTTLVGSALVSAPTASAAGSYQTTGTVNVRNGPGTSYGVVGSASNGAGFTLLCQYQGGTNVSGNATWDEVRFSSGLVGMISDYWTTTPSWNSYAPGTHGCSVDITGWCQVHYGSGYFHGVVVTANVYGWQCQYGTDAGTRFGVDMNAACAYTYGGPGSASFNSYSDPASWYCY